MLHLTNIELDHKTVTLKNLSLYLTIFYKNINFVKLEVHSALSHQGYVD